MDQDLEILMLNQKDLEPGMQRVRIWVFFDENKIFFIN
jgi:hypothetical protein